MLEGETNKAKIGNNSNQNIILQNSSVNNSTFFWGSNIDGLMLAAESGRYDIVQKYVAHMMDVSKRTHPLFPEFSAKYDTKLEKLVSTPETKDALLKHPKTIKGTYLLDYSKYPYLDHSETPWEYAYRTQTEVEMDTTSYTEYLGDLEDPFPV